VKRRLKVYGGIALAVVVAWAALDYFSVETAALAWHVRHGFHAELGGIRMRVPLSYEADDPTGLPGLTMIRRSGRLWRGGGIITIDFNQPSPEALQAIEAMHPNKLIEKNKVGERTVTFAGRTGTCIEYIPQTTDTLLNELIKATGSRDIDCWFGGVGVELLGTASLKEDFYNIIQTAEPTGRKN
jgi:hypothetical protein